MRAGVEGGEGFDFSMQLIFWNKLFTGKNQLKHAKYLAPQISIWHLEVLKKQKFINIAFVIFIIVTPIPMKYDTKQTWYKWGQRKKWPSSSKKICGWSSRIFHDLLKFWWNPFLHLPENLLPNRSFLLCLFNFFFCYQTIDTVFLKTLQKSIFVDSY